MITNTCQKNNKNNKKFPQNKQRHKQKTNKQTRLQ